MLPGVSSLRTKTSVVRPLLKSILSSQRRLAAVETCYSAFFVSEHPNLRALSLAKSRSKLKSGFKSE